MTIPRLTISIPMIPIMTKLITNIRAVEAECL